jgi:hypothetical protein
LLCALINIAVLIASDNVPSSKWPERIAPHTIIGTVLSVSGFCLAAAIGEGVSIAWWRKGWLILPDPLCTKLIPSTATQGATVKQLHQSWTYTAGTHNILTHLFALDIIALAILAAKVTVLDSFLFQNAASTYVAPLPAYTVTLLGVAAKEFPQTAYVVAEGSYMISDTFTGSVNTWYIFS